MKRFFAFLLLAATIALYSTAAPQQATAGPNSTPTPTPCVPALRPCPTPTPCPAGVICHPTSTPTPCHPTSAVGIPCNPTPKPNPTATPCHPSSVVGQPCNPTPEPCRDATGRTIPCKDLPDLTSGVQIIIGGAVGGGPLPSGVVGHHVPWGGSVLLSDKDAFLVSNGRCAFNISYELANIGNGNAGPPATFKDVILAGSPPADVSIQSALTQAAHTHRAINTQAYLPAPGPYALILSINDGHLIPETTYANNVFSIHYTLDTSKCMSRG